MGGKTCPKESGQSGTARPEPVLVTSPPRKSSTKVAPAVAAANRWSPEPERCAMPSTPSCNRCATARTRPTRSLPSLGRSDTGSRQGARAVAAGCDDDISTRGGIRALTRHSAAEDGASRLVRRRSISRRFRHGTCVSKSRARADSQPGPQASSATPNGRRHPDRRRRLWGVPIGQHPRLLLPGAADLRPAGVVYPCLVGLLTLATWLMVFGS